METAYSEFIASVFWATANFFSSRFYEMWNSSGIDFGAFVAEMKTE